MKTKGPNMTTVTTDTDTNTTDATTRNHERPDGKAAARTARTPHIQKAVLHPRTI